MTPYDHSLEPPDDRVLCERAPCDDYDPPIVYDDPADVDNKMEVEWETRY
jgi:hypothetical protein